MKNSLGSAHVRSSVSKRLDAADARAWTRFRQKLQEVTSYTEAQALADAVPLRANFRERLLYARLGRYIQTREVPEDATADERQELEVLLLRLSIAQGH